MIKKILLAAAAPVLLMASLSASAGVLGIADLNISSFILVNSATNAPVTTGITISNDARTGTAASNFNGVDGTGAGNGSISSISPGANVDVKYRCAGPDCGTLAGIYGTVENNTTTHISTPTKNYALGDMFINGQAVSASGANGLTRADTSVTKSLNSGGSSATILNSASATTTFSPTQSITAFFALTYEIFVKAYIDPTNPSYEKSFASGGTNFALTVRSSDDAGFTTLFFSPDALNVGLTAGSSAENAQVSTNGSLVSDSRTLVGGKHYTLTITQASNSLASEVPEPTSLALMGLGLLAAGASVARRRKS